MNFVAEKEGQKYIVLSFDFSILQLIVYLFELFITQLIIKMIRIENEIQYKAVMDRIENLLPLVTDDTPLNDGNLKELQMLSMLVVDFDEAHYPL